MRLKEIYFQGFNYIAANRRAAGDMEMRVIHTHLLTVITTGALMWGYAFLAYFTIDHPVPAAVGFLCSLVHGLSPLMYRFSKSALLNASVLLAAGICHQASFAYFTGGYNGNIFIWFGILPFLGAIIAGKKGAILWCCISLAATSGFLLLNLIGIPVPSYISSTGFLYAQGFISFGWIFLSAILSYAYLVQEEALNEERLEKKTRIENLFRVLCHDISNPLTLLQMGMEQFNLSIDPTTQKKSLEITHRAINSLIDLTNNVRNLYSVKEGKVEISCQPIALNSSIEEITFLFQERLVKKNIQFQYDPIENEKAVVLVEPISFVHQVLGNIISNAIKFSSEGEKIIISTHVEDNDFVKLKIQDEGIGMPTPILDNIFDIEARTSRTGTSGEKGTGYGMHLMKTYVEKYQGFVEVSSIEKSNGPNHGTCFVLKLRGYKA